MRSRGERASCCIKGWPPAPITGTGCARVSSAAVDPGRAPPLPRMMARTIGRGALARARPPRQHCLPARRGEPGARRRARRPKSGARRSPPARAAHSRPRRTCGAFGHPGLPLKGRSEAPSLGTPPKHAINQSSKQARSKQASPKRQSRPSRFARAAGAAPRLRWARLLFAHQIPALIRSTANTQGACARAGARPGYSRPLRRAPARSPPPPLCGGRPGAGAGGRARAPAGACYVRPPSKFDAPTPRWYTRQLPLPPARS